MVLKSECILNHLEDLLKYRLLGSTPSVSDPADLGWGLSICISNTFPDNADAAGLGESDLEKRIAIPQEVQCAKTQ